METLRAELAQAKEQARRSDAAALKAVEELRAEQAAHRQSEDKIAKMAVESKDAASVRQIHQSGQPPDPQPPAHESNMIIT